MYVHVIFFLMLAGCYDDMIHVPCAIDFFLTQNFIKSFVMKHIDYKNKLKMIIFPETIVQKKLTYLYY